DIFVLKAISDSDGYGYDILNYIHDKTEGHYEMKQSSVYSVLKRLEKQGYIYSFTNDETNGAKRRYYALTDQGKTLLEEQEKEWAYTRTLLDNLVSNKSFDLQNDTPPFHPSDLRPMTRRAPRDDFSVDPAPASVVSTPQEENITDSTQENTSPIPVQAADEIKKQESTSEVAESVIPSPVTDENAASVEVSSDPLDIKSSSSYSKEVVEPVIADTSNDIPTFSTGYSDMTKVHFEDDAEFRRKAVAALYEGATTEPVSTVVTPSDEPPYPLSTAKEPVDVEVPSSRIDSSLSEKSVVQTEEKCSDGTNYRDFYNGLFGPVVDKKATSASSEAPQIDYTDIDCSHINDLKARLEDEGIKLRSYDPTTTNKSSIKYLLTNKIIRDTSILGYLTLVIMLLIVGLVKEFSVSLTAILIVGGIGLLAPSLCTMVELNNPNKRVKDGIKPSKICLFGFAAYVVIFIVSLIINLLVPNGHSLNTVATYAPAIIALFIPLTTIIFLLLYRSEKYHLINH
ncbi:MAG: PadR family transcriptional regulator, partial [Clostridia bacterium]|nr:PadR family transcriptional regulator [Clostridia bacterium]